MPHDPSKQEREQNEAQKLLLVHVIYWVEEFLIEEKEKCDHFIWSHFIITSIEFKISQTTIMH